MSTNGQRAAASGRTRAASCRQGRDLGGNQGGRAQAIARVRKRTEARLVDTMIGAYVDWREACRLVHEAYQSWASSTGAGARVTFWRYRAALDAEEWAAEVYASLVRQVAQPATRDDDLSGPLAA
jgi:hypothetical protein